MLCRERRTQGHRQSGFSGLWEWQRLPDDALTAELFGPGLNEDSEAAQERAESSDEEPGWEGDGGAAGGDDFIEDGGTEVPYVPDADFDAGQLYFGDFGDYGMDEWLDEVLQMEDHRLNVRVVGISSDGIVTVMMPVYIAGDGAGGAENPAATHPCMGRAAAAQVLQDEWRQAGVAAVVQEARQSPFSFLQLRLLSFNDGVALCSSCSYPGCDRNRDVCDLFEREIALPDQERTLSGNVLGGNRPLCRCAHAAMKVLFGVAAATNVQAHNQFNGCQVTAWIQENCAEQDAWGALPSFLMTLLSPWPDKGVGTK